MLGTRNPKKRQEIVEILGDLGWEFGDLSDRPDIPDVEETGTTFEANAKLKAIAFAKAVSASTPAPPKLAMSSTTSPGSAAALARPARIRIGAVASREEASLIAPRRLREVMSQLLVRHRPQPILRQAT